MKKSPFQGLPTPSPDPIFSVMAEALAAGPGVLNCTAGVLLDEDGRVSLLPSVAKAIADVCKEFPKERFGYPVLLGVPSFRAAVERLIFGESHPWSVASIASTGGTGALAINLRLMKTMLKSGRLILPSPAWANHLPPALAANLEVLKVPYLKNGTVSIDAVMDAAKKENGDFGLLLQVGCHNPTGLDLTEKQWKDIVDLLKDKDCVVLLDSAYQGLKDEPEKDIAPIRLFLDAGIPTLLTWSAAKNHTIYALRSGLACAVLPTSDLIPTLEGHYSRITRQLHSSSATPGQRVVARTQEAYFGEWVKDLRMARAVIERKRALMKATLPERFHPALAGYGMFAMLPLTVPQIDVLKSKHKVFMTADGRINIAGIPEARMKEFCEKVQAVESFKL